MAANEVRFVVDVRRSPEGRIEGSVSSGGTTRTFSGWLELMRCLEITTDELEITKREPTSINPQD